MDTFAVRPRHTTCRTLLHAAHDAFRRDLDRLAAAAAAGKGRAPHVRAGWENLKEQIRLHHDLEDEWLWPRVERAVAGHLPGGAAGRSAERAVLEEMRAEHARTVPLIGRVDAAMAGGGDLPGAVRDLREALELHLRHEEMSALPLAEAVLADGEWRALAGEARRRCEAGTPLFVPWVVDGIAPVERSRFLTALPEPLRELNRVMWEPRYRKRRLWAS
ncbi:hemerythrin domain-containing protein [Actinomadura darangshiensis]|uniref:Hemerythrin domain-containing protein n=1 Tax=Actinomadura darangshiensis TaxID=705336 RepID=A0A4R4ZT22_9ACTN|nr:hemerythrin domain-containing protein [Actinomadura darangshiensis]TDD61426.1 hemerythrin domain-containing protein [Actinomadura darangshiensis]